MKRIIALLLIVASSLFSQYMTTEILDRVKNNGVFYGNKFIQFTGADNQTTFARVAFGNGLYVSMPSNLVVSVWTSTNGVTWVSNSGAITTLGVTNLVRLTYGTGSGFIALYQYTNGFQFSTNGTNWSLYKTLVTNAQWVCSLYNSNRDAWMAIADLCNQIVVTTNITITWNTNIRTTGTIVNNRACAINFAGTMVVVGRTNLPMWSRDMTNWYTNYNLGAGLTNWTSVASDGTNFMAICAGTNLIAKSADGSNWIVSNITEMPNTATYGAIRYGGGSFMVVPYGVTNFVVVLSNAVTNARTVAQTNSLMLGNWESATWSPLGWVITGYTNWIEFSVDPWRYSFYPTKKFGIETGAYFLIKNNLYDKPFFNLSVSGTNNTISDGRLAMNLYEGVKLQGASSNRYVIASNAIFFNPGYNRNTNYYGAWFDTFSNSFYISSLGNNIYDDYIMPGDKGTFPIQMSNNFWYLIEITNISCTAGIPYYVELYIYK